MIEFLSTGPDGMCIALTNTQACEYPIGSLRVLAYSTDFQCPIGQPLTFDAQPGSSMRHSLAMLRIARKKRVDGKRDRKTLKN